jgi:dihydropteroate synthase
MMVIKEPVVMGIINSTPDSFYKGSRTEPGKKLLEVAGKMISEGALILDLGGQSTRPGSIQVSEEEELKRIIPAIEIIHKKFPEQLISIDSFYARVAREAVGAGASIVNDIGAGLLDEAMISTVAELKVPYVLMHMQGKPFNMQDKPSYENLITDVFDFLNFRIDSITKAGINDVIIDVGFGFGKSITDNFRLLGGLSYFKKLGKPILAGLSRKGTVYKTLGIQPEDALNGSTVLHTIALMNGASILRVHDVKPAVEAVKLFMACEKEKEQY